MPKEEFLQEYRKMQGYQHYDKKGATPSKTSAPYREQKLGSMTIRAARGYEDSLSEALGLDPDAWQEPSSIEDDSDKYELADSNNLWMLKERKAELERRRKELEDEINSIERKIRES